MPCSGRCKCSDCRNRTQQGGEEASPEDQSAEEPPSPVRVRPKRRNSQPRLLPNSDDGESSPAAPPQSQRPVRSKRRPSIVENDNDD